MFVHFALTALSLLAVLEHLDLSLGYSKTRLCVCVCVGPGEESPHAGGQRGGGAFERTNQRTAREKPAAGEREPHPANTQRHHIAHTHTHTVTHNMTNTTQDITLATQTFTYAA